MGGIHKDPRYGNYPRESDPDYRDEEINFMRQKIFDLSDQILELHAKIISYERYLNIPPPPVSKKFGEL